MIAFLDGNTIWRRKFGDALKRRVADTVVCLPYSGASPSSEPDDMAIGLPRGWAGATAWLGMRLLLRKLRRVTGRDPRTIVLTVPHYLPLAELVTRNVRIIYYCSHEYRAYAGWNGAKMARDEAALCRRAAVSIFVSEALRTRAVREYGLDIARTFVSPNATEQRFAEAGARARRAEVAALAGPVFGVAGVVNTRIDLAFLCRIAEDERVGSLVLVGPIDSELGANADLARLRANPKVHVFGPQPHSEMPEWMASFDIAVIPYADTALNHFCSPMRLYDHLAIGQPIIATRHCDQIASRQDIILADERDVADRIGQALAMLATGRRPKVETWDDRIDTVLAAHTVFAD